MVLRLAWIYWLAASSIPSTLLYTHAALSQALTDVLSQELINFPKFHLTPDIKKALYSHNKPIKLPESTPNPSLLDTAAGLDAFYDHAHSQGYGNGHGHGNGNGNGNGLGTPKLRIPIERRYYAAAGSPSTLWPPEMHAYNASFTTLLEKTAPYSAYLTSRMPLSVSKRLLRLLSMSIPFTPMHLAYP